MGRWIWGGETLPPLWRNVPGFPRKGNYLQLCNQNHFLPLHFVFLTFSFKTWMGNIVSHLYDVESERTLGANAHQAPGMAIFYLGIRL